ncbi:hypothetical protein NECID01_1217 [Nematocida sp. AWRm77]|nr:hypothetical protein NECID01_1217 [Nematocida sp. AWRm77]
MIQGLLVVSLSGGLVYNELRYTDSQINVDKIIGLASTVYTGVEILQEQKLYSPGAKYKTTRFVFEHGEITAFKTETKLMFIVLHKDSPFEEVEKYLEKVHRRYVEAVLYNPLYKVDGAIMPRVLDYL